MVRLILSRNIDKMTEPKKVLLALNYFFPNAPVTDASDKNNAFDLQVGDCTVEVKEADNDPGNCRYYDEPNRTIPIEYMQDCVVNEKLWDDPAWVHKSLGWMYKCRADYFLYIKYFYNKRERGRKVVGMKAFLIDWPKMYSYIDCHIAELTDVHQVHLTTNTRIFNIEATVETGLIRTLFKGRI